MLEGLVGSCRADQCLAHVMPYTRVQLRRHGVLQQRKAKHDRFVELMLEAQRLELLDPSIDRPAIPARGIPTRSSLETLDSLSSAGGDDLERSHRRPGLAGFDEKDGLSREVGARKLRHAQGA